MSDLLNNDNRNYSNLQGQKSKEESRLTNDTDSGISTKSRESGDIESNISEPLNLFVQDNVQKNAQENTEKSAKKSKISRFQSAISSLEKTLPRILGKKKEKNPDVNRKNRNIDIFSKITFKSHKSNLFSRMFGTPEKNHEDKYLSESVVSNEGHEKPGIIKTVGRTVGGFLHNEQDVIASDTKSAKIRSASQKFGFGTLGFLKIVSGMYSKLATIPFASGVETIFTTVIGASIITFFTATVSLWAAIAITIAGSQLLLGSGYLCINLLL